MVGGVGGSDVTSVVLQLGGGCSDVTLVVLQFCGGCSDVTSVVIQFGGGCNDDVTSVVLQFGGRVAAGGGDVRVDVFGDALVGVGVRRLRVVVGARRERVVAVVRLRFLLQRVGPVRLRLAARRKQLRRMALDVAHDGLLAMTASQDDVDDDQDDDDDGEDDQPD